MDQPHTAAVIEELLASLAAALPDAERPDFQVRASLIRSLLVPEAQFSTVGFVGDQVGRALDD